MVEVIDVAPGLWLWRQRHPDWREGLDWDAEVASFFVESRGERIVLDPLAAPPAAGELWQRLEASPPTVAVVLKPDHVRDVDLFVRWYGCRAFGPHLYFAGDAPKTQLELVVPGDELPGGLQALYDGRREVETPVYLPEQRAVVFADALIAADGTLRVWHTRWHDERVLPALRKLLELPFKHVLVSHGEPVHSRADFEAALAAEPYTGS